MVLRFDVPRDYELLFVDLAGRGIRDLAAVEGGMLVLGGPIGDGDGSHELYFWDLKDAIPGTDGSPGHVQRLGTIAATAAAKPEGIAVLEQSAGQVEFLLVRDGATDAHAELFRVALPR